jgi:hypothetical protein
MKVQLLAITLLSSLYLTGCNSEASESVNTQSAVTEITFEVVHKNDGMSSNPVFSSEGTESLRYAKVLHNQLAYEEELAKYPEEQPRALNFNESSLVAINMGQKGSSGYSLSVSSVVEEDKYVLVNLLHNDPTSCVRLSVVTQPYLFVLINTKKPILFSEQLNAPIVSC